MRLMRRKIDDFLKEWKENEDRLPLIVKGARQIGKTHPSCNLQMTTIRTWLPSILFYGIKLCNKNIGFNGKFYTFPYFLAFLLKRFVSEK